MVAIVTIPKELSREELVLIPRKQYEELLDLKKIITLIKPTPSEKKAIKEAREELRKGEYLTIRQLQHELGC